MTFSAAVAAGGSIAVRGQVRSADPDAPLSFVAELEDVPVTLIESLARSGVDLPAVVGPQANLTLDVDLPNGLRRSAGAVDGRIDLSASAQHLEVEAHVQTGERIALTRPARVRWTLTPAAALALAPEANFRMARAATVVLDVGKAVHGDAGTTLEATAGVSGLEVTGPKGRTLRLPRLRIDLSSPNVRETLLVKLAGDVAGTERPGSIRGTVNLENLSAGRRASVKTDLTVERVPVGPLDGIMDMEGMLLAFLGPEASARAGAAIADGAGPVDLRFTSGHLEAALAGRVTADAFLLRAPVTAELVLSEQFAKIVLPKMGPFFRGIESTEQPIRLRVESDGFRVPRSLDVAGITIPSASLDIGKVVLQNQTILEVLKKLSRVDLPDRTTAWFTPLRIGMKNGEIRYQKRIDMLFDQQFHLATWGEVNVTGNRVDMVFALMPETVKQLLRIKGAGADSTLQIPIRGTLDNPKVDVGKAVANIAALRAKEEALKNLPELGRIIAERALGKLLGDTLSGAPALAASMDPLPWEER